MAMPGLCRFLHATNYMDRACWFPQAHRNRVAPYVCTITYLHAYPFPRGHGRWHPRGAPARPRTCGPFVSTTRTTRGYHRASLRCVLGQQVLNYIACMTSVRSARGITLPVNGTGPPQSGTVAAWLRPALPRRRSRCSSSHGVYTRAGVAGGAGRAAAEAERPVGVGARCRRCHRARP